METLLRFVFPLIVAVAAAAAIWGAVRNQVKTNAREISELRGSYNTIMGVGSNPGQSPLFVSTGSCESNVRRIEERLGYVERKIDRQTRSLKGMQSYARFMLTKEGLPLEKINEIVDGDE